jgi:hypothetical protein
MYRAGAADHEQRGVRRAAQEAQGPQLPRRPPRRQHPRPAPLCTTDETRGACIDWLRVTASAGWPEAPESLNMRCGEQDPLQVTSIAKHAVRWAGAAVPGRQIRGQGASLTPALPMESERKRDLFLHFS